MYIIMAMHYSFGGGVREGGEGVNLESRQCM